MSERNFVVWTICANTKRDRWRACVIDQDTRSVIFRTPFVEGYHNALVKLNHILDECVGKA